MGQNKNILEKVKQLTLARVPGTTLTIWFTPVDQDGVDVGLGSSYDFTNDTPVSLITMVGASITGATDFRFRTSNEFRYARNTDANTGALTTATTSANMATFGMVNNGLFQELD